MYIWTSKLLRFTRCFWIQTSHLIFQCAFPPQTFKSLKKNQMCFCTSTSFKSSPFQFKICILNLKQNPLKVELLIPSNMHNCTQQPQIISFSIQMTLIPSNIHNLHSTTSNEVIFNSNDLNTYNCIQWHSTTSNHVPFNSNVDNNTRPTQIKSCSTHMTFNTTQYAQMYSTNSKRQSIA